jgi:hypothetical protein
MDIAVRKTRFVRILKERLFLRFHMSLILIGAALVGLLASKLLLLSLVTNIVVRYPLAVVVAYLAFFGFIKLWLAYISSSHERSSYDAADATADVVGSIPDFSGARMPSLPTFGGGGGGLSGGGGASGSFEVVGTDVSKAAFSVISDSRGGIGKTAGDAAGDAASGIVEEGGWVLVVLGILLAIVFGAGIYLVYENLEGQVYLLVIRANISHFLAQGRIPRSLRQPPRSRRHHPENREILFCRKMSQIL